MAVEYNMKAYSAQKQQVIKWNGLEHDFTLIQSMS